MRAVSVLNIFMRMIFYDVINASNFMVPILLKAGRRLREAEKIHAMRQGLLHEV